MGRVLAIDLGSKRIGLAMSDPSRTLASPLATLQRSGDPAIDHLLLGGMAEENGVDLVLVGMPTSLSGKAGPAAKAAETEIAALRSVLNIPVETVDERLSTVVAGQALGSAGKNSRKQRNVIDQSAACVLLQEWLDRQPR